MLRKLNKLRWSSFVFGKLFSVSFQGSSSLFWNNKENFDMVMENTKKHLFPGVLKKFAVLTGKHPCWSLFIKKRLQRRCFSVNVATFLRLVFIEHFWWLLLKALMENTNVMIFNHINKFINVFLSISQQKVLQKGFSSLRLFT